MKSKTIKWVFWILIAAFVFAAITIFTPLASRLFMNPAARVLIPISGGALLLLGGALIFLTVKQHTQGILKKFLLLTGASAAGMPVGVLLHGAVFAVFIRLLGENFWQRIGIEDEPFFFMLAVVVCPLGFLVGAIGSIVLSFRSRNKVAEQVGKQSHGT